MRRLRSWLDFTGVRIALGILVAVTLVMGGTLYWLDRQHRQGMETLLDAMMRQVSVQASGYFALLNRTMGIVGSELAHERNLGRLVAAGDREGVARQLTDVPRRVGVDEVAVLDPSGRIFYQTGRIPFEGERLDYAFLFDALRRGKATHGMVRVGDLFVHYTALALMDARHPVGYLLLGLVIDDGMMRDLKDGGDVEFALVGDRAVSAASMRIGGEPLRELPVPYPLYRQLLKEGSLYETRIEGRRYVVAARPFASLEVYPRASLMLLYDMQRLAPLQETARRVQWEAFVGLFLLFAVILWVAYGLFYRRNVRALLARIDCFRRGKGVCHTPVRLDGEYAVIDRAVEEMATELSAVRERLREHATALENRVAARTEELERSNRFLTGLLETMRELVAVVEEGQVRFVNRAMLDFFDFPDLKSFLEHDALDAILDRRGEPLCELLARRSGEGEMPLRLRTRRGEARYFEMAVHRIDAEACRYMILLRDVTLLETRAREMAKLAMEDPLSGLPNRRQFDRMLARAHERVVRGEGSAALLLVDVDNFKQINDRFGHDEGDRLIKLLAATLRKKLRRSDFVGRWGGEEFAILVNTDLGTACGIAENILEAVRQIEFHDLDVTVSVGIAALDPRSTPEEAFIRADRALYRAKAEGKDRVVVG